MKRVETRSDARRDLTGHSLGSPIPISVPALGQRERPATLVALARLAKPAQRHPRR